MNQLSNAATPAEREQALILLAPVIPDASPSPASVIAVFAGALVEQGTSPDKVAVAVITRLQTLLEDAAPFIQAYLETGVEGERVPLPEFFQTMVKSMRKSAAAWAGISLFALSAETMLAFSEPVRRRVLTEGTLAVQIAPIITLDQRVKGLDTFLKRATPQPMTVLHPDTRQGYRLQMVGIATNFQLHTLLADALIGNPEEGWLRGHRPDSASVAAAHGDTTQDALSLGVFNLVSWHALRRDFTVSDNSDYWIWNEGTPDDIPLFEDQRVLLLTPPPYVRSWRSGNGIHGLRAEITVLEKLDTGASEALLNKIAQAAEQRLVDHPDTPKQGRAPKAVGSASGSTEHKPNAAPTTPDLVKMLAQYKPLLKSTPGLVDELFAQGRALVGGGDFKNAETLFSTLLEVQPTGEIYFYRGFARRKMDDFDGALADYVAATNLNPTLFEAYVNRTPIYERQGDYQAIVDVNTIALSIEPSSAFAYNNRAEAYNKLGNHQAAIADVDRAIKIDLTKASFYHTRGTIHAAMGDTVRAAQDFKQTLEQDLNHDEAANIRQKLSEWGY